MGTKSKVNFKEGYKPYVFTEKDRLTKLANRKLSNCENCKKEILAYAPLQRFCSKKCAITFEKKLREAQKWHDPVRYKAKTLGANVRMGKNKTVLLQTLIEESLEKPCKYCGEILDILNISLDHIEPIGRNEIRRRKAEFVEERIYLDRLENLQIICRKCNSLKGKIPHTKFVKLLKFLAKDKILKDLVLNRLRQSVILWQKRH